MSGRMVSGAAIALACAGCSQLFGLDSPERTTGGDARLDDSALVDLGVDMGDDAAPSDSLPVTTFVRRLDVVDAKVIGGPHTDFPMLVTISAQWLRTTTNAGNVASASGFDIYFSTDQAGTSRLAHEVESYNPTTGALVAWVKIPSLSATTTLFIHYGDTAITTSQENRAAVWLSSGYALVMHLTGTPADASSNNTISNTGIAAGTGKVAGAATFSGTTTVINGGSAGAIDDVFGGGGAVDAWIRPSSFGGNSLGRIVQKGTPGWLWFVDDVNGVSSMTFYQTLSTNDGRWSAPNNSITLNAWQHVAVVYDKANTPAMYINGAAVSVSNGSPPAGMVASDSGATLYAGNDDAGTRAFDGLIDEIRVSSVSRSAGWFGTQFQNQSDPQAFFTVTNPL